LVTYPRFDPTRRTAFEIATLVLVCLGVHALVLRFIFPGYYDPLWPHHSDFYFPANFAQSALGPADLLRWPRPVGTIFLQATGFLGTRGAIAVTVILFALNCAVTAAILRRFLLDPFDRRFLAAYAVFVFLVVAHPHFYEFYTHDMLSQLSYLLLACAIHFLLRFLDEGRLRLALACAVLALAALLAKETYAASGAAIAAALALGRWKKPGGRRALAGLGLILATFVAALVVNRLNGSPFTGGGGEASSPYQLNLSPGSLWGELWRYGRESFNAASLALVLAVAGAMAVFDGRSSRRVQVALVLPIAGVMAWLGNAALPNHHFAGYSWNGAYLVHAPLLALAPFLSLRARAVAAATGVIAMALLVPSLNGATYRANGWFLEQEARQRALLQALARLGAQMPATADGARILVTGIDFPFSPFDSGLALKAIPNLESATFDVLRYPATPVASPEESRIIAKAPNVRMLPRDQAHLDDYDFIWMFRSNGTVAASMRPDEITGFAPGKNAPFAAIDWVVYPQLFDILSASTRRAAPETVGTKALACGADMLAKNELDKAEWCLALALRDIPANPYPHFYLGAIREKRGDLEGARKLYARAMDLDDKKSPNAYFAEALARVRN
jgi:hypothetical protein